MPYQTQENSERTNRISLYDRLKEINSIEELIKELQKLQKDFPENAAIAKEAIDDINTLGKGGSLPEFAAFLDRKTGDVRKQKISVLSQRLFSLFYSEAELGYDEHATDWFAKKNNDYADIANQLIREKIAELLAKL